MISGCHGLENGLNTKGQQRGVWGVMELLCILIVMCVTCAKSHRTVPLSQINLTVKFLKVKLKKIRGLPWWRSG